MKTLYDFIVERLKIRKNDKGETVPEICPECGGKIVVAIKGEPIFICKECNKYYGTVPFTHESSDWIDDVDTKWTPEEGLFTNEDPEYIADYLIKNSKDTAQAMRRLVFYMNRAGEDCPNKKVLEKVKQIIKSKE